MNSLKAEKLNALLIYDAQTGNLKWKDRPFWMFKSLRGMRIFDARYAGKDAGSISTCGKSNKQYMAIRIGGKLHYSHRIIHTMMTGLAPNGLQIDHIDGNGLNNSWENLRIVSASENSKNQKLRGENKTGFVGVFYLSKDKKWAASIGVNGQSIHLGRFNTKDAAIKARAEAQVRYGFHENHGVDRDLFRLELALRESDQ